MKIQHSLQPAGEGHYYLMANGLQTDCPYSGVIMAQHTVSTQLVPVRYPCSSRCALFELIENNTQSDHREIELHCTHRKLIVTEERQSSLKIST